MDLLKKHKIKAVRDGDDMVFTIPRKWTLYDTKTFIEEFEWTLYPDSYR